MYKILIDTTERFNKSIKLVEDDKEIDEIRGDIDVVPVIRDILEKHDLSVKDIGEFVANPGPGSFTGIKIGITVANVLNWALGKKKIDDLIRPEYGKEPNIQK